MGNWGRSFFFLVKVLDLPISAHGGCKLSFQWLTLLWRLEKDHHAKKFQTWGIFVKLRKSYQKKIAHFDLGVKLTEEAEAHSY